MAIIAFSFYFKIGDIRIILIGAKRKLVASDSASPPKKILMKKIFFPPQLFLGAGMDRDEMKRLMIERYGTIKKFAEHTGLNYNSIRSIFSQRGKTSNVYILRVARILKGEHYSQELRDIWDGIETMGTDIIRHGRDLMRKLIDSLPPPLFASLLGRTEDSLSDIIEGLAMPEIHESYMLYALCGIQPYASNIDRNKLLSYMGLTKHQLDDKIQELHAEGFFQQDLGD